MTVCKTVCTFLAFIALCFITVAVGQRKDNCQIIADIGIVVDSSGSLRREFHKEVQFVKDLAKKLTVSEDGVNIGVVTFSYYAQLTIKLSANKDTASFVKAAGTIPLMKSQTYIDRALRVAHTELFTEANGDRKNAPNILIVLTDGKQTQSQYSTPPERQADILRKNGVEIIAVGIGRGVDGLELATLTGKPENVLLPKSFDELLTGAFLEKIVNKACAKAVEKPALLCATGLDVGFLVDSSQYKKEDFLAVKALVKRMVSGFSYNATGPKAGLVSFSERASLEMPFIDYKNPSIFANSVDKLTQTGRTRQIGEGIKVAFNQLFGERTGARRNTPRLLVLITTGTQTKNERSLLPSFDAESFHEVDQKILAIGIGPDVDEEELPKILVLPKNGQ